MARITMQDIAENCHVSIATVSRALHNNPGVSEHLRALIREYAEDHGYVPNLVAQSLRSSQADVAYIISRVGTDGQSPMQMPPNEKLKSIVGIDTVSHAILLHDDLIERLHQLESIVRPRLFVIVGPTLVVEPERFDSIHSPLLFVEADGAPRNYPSISSDDQAGTEALVDSLIEAGHRRIALLTISNKSPALNYPERLQSYRSVLERHNIPYDPSLVLSMPVDFDDMYSSAKAELNDRVIPALRHCSPRPTALLILSDFLTLIFSHVAPELGVKIPEDLSIASFGGWNVTNYLPVPVQSSVQPIDDIVEATTIAMSCMIKQQPFPSTLKLSSRHPDGSHGEAYAVASQKLVVKGYMRMGKSVTAPHA